MIHQRLRHWAKPLKGTPFHPHWLFRYGPRINERLAPAHGETLDIGCANRWPEPFLKDRSRYVALDYPETGAKLYKARPDVFADAAALPFAANSFDTVLLFEVLEHVPQATQSLSEIARVLKSGGRLLLTVPFLYPMHDEPHDYRRYTQHGLQQKLEKAGLIVETLRPNLHSSAAAGLLLNLALSGMCLSAVRQNRVAALLLPLLAIAILGVNLTAWLGKVLLPSWPAFTAGYMAVALKP